MIKVFIMVMIIIIVMILVMIMRMIIITKKKNDENYLKLNWRLNGKKDRIENNHSPNLFFCNVTEHFNRR